jgi:hypothetical protein
MAGVRFGKLIPESVDQCPTELIVILSRRDLAKLLELDRRGFAVPPPQSFAYSKSSLFSDFTFV